MPMLVPMQICDTWSTSANPIYKHQHAKGLAMFCESKGQQLLKAALASFKATFATSASIRVGKLITVSLFHRVCPISATYLALLIPAKSQALRWPCEVSAEGAAMSLGTPGACQHRNE